MIRSGVERAAPRVLPLPDVCRSPPRTPVISGPTGRLSNEEPAELRSDGLGDDELVEIIGVIGWYVMSTYTNNLAQTEIDDFFQPPPGEARPPG